MMDSIGFAPRQPLGYLRDLFAARGIHPKKKLGQNSLIDVIVMDVFLRAAEIDKTGVVLADGTGPGSLTHRRAVRPAALRRVQCHGADHGPRADRPQSAGAGSVLVAAASRLFDCDGEA